MTTTVLLAPRPQLTVLPACVVAGGKLARSYPGNPNVIGWAVFTRTTSTYMPKDDELFAAEQDAINYLHNKYGCWIDLSRDSLTGARG